MAGRKGDNSVEVPRKGRQNERANRPGAIKGKLVCDICLEYQIS